MPLRPHARTIAIARFLRAVAPERHRRRGGRLYRQVQPDLIRAEYLAAILPILREQLAPLRAAGREAVRLLAEERDREALARGRMDAAGDRHQRAQALIEKAGRAAAEAFRPRALEDAAQKFGRRTSAFQKAQLDRQVQQALAVPLSAIEKPVTDPVPEWTARNVDLIKTISEKHHSRLQAEVQNAFDSGMRPETLAERIQAVEDVSDSDAARIARDQIGKLNGQLNQERQEAMGVTGYTWRTVKDARVRDEHADREGVHFEWNDPPEDGHPGEPIQCRCFAEPDFEPILADL